MPSLQLLQLTEHGRRFLSSRRKSLLLASGILVAGGTAAYMQSRSSRKQCDSVRNCNGPGSSTEATEIDNSSTNIYKGRPQKKNALRSLQVLVATLLSQMGRRGTHDLLALVSVVILAPRIGYLPLLVPQIKPLFSGTLPPGEDTVWFEYKGLPLKWYIPTGVLFDLLCAEPERPWNLTIHFRSYPSNILTPCKDEETVKWSFINSLKEAAYIISGSSKNIMNMSQSDQLELWRSVLNGNLESFLKVTSKLKLVTIEDDYTTKLYPSSNLSSDASNADNPGLAKTGRIPVRLYVRIFTEAFDDLEDAPEFDSWEKISYINRPVGFDKDDGKCFTLGHAMKTLLPEYFGYGTPSTEKLTNDEVKEVNPEGGDQKVIEEVSTSAIENPESKQLTERAEIKLIRIQGIEPKAEIPFSWVANNLVNPDHYVHVCVYLLHLKPDSL